MTPHDLDILINRYFEGETTAAEEQRLRALLADPSYDSEAADEARVAMAAFGILVEKRGSDLNAKPRFIRSSWSTAARAAAVAAVILGCTFAFLRPSSPDCVAYAYGHRVESPELALQFMMDDLEAMGNAQEAVQAQINADFSALGEAFYND